MSAGYTYLQEFLPARRPRRASRAGTSTSSGSAAWCSSYPDLPRDVLAGRPLDRRRICRTFSDCTTAPRNGLAAGCYPLDQFYRERPERESLEARKRAS